MGQRRRARECALQILYQLDAQAEPGGGPGEPELATLAEQLRLYWTELTSASLEGAPASPAVNRAGQVDADVQGFAETLVRGVLSRRAEIDDTIQKASRNWRLERMARVDRNVLRLATYELLFLPEIPKRVTLNEAIELAKRFGSEDSGAFINGVLDRISHPVDKP